jgi:hypothetical protein
MISLSQPLQLFTSSRPREIKPREIRPRPRTILIISHTPTCHHQTIHLRNFSLSVPLHRGVEVRSAGTVSAEKDRVQSPGFNLRPQPHLLAQRHPSAMDHFTRQRRPAYLPCGTCNVKHVTGSWRRTTFGRVSFSELFWGLLCHGV